MKGTCTKVPHLQTKLNVAIFVLQKNAADLLSECYQELVRYVLFKKQVQCNVFQKGHVFTYLAMQLYFSRTNQKRSFMHMF